MTVLNDAPKIYAGDQEATAAYLGEALVWGTPAAGPWSPIDLGGLAIWLDASMLGLAHDAEVFNWPNLGSEGDPTMYSGSARMHTGVLNGKPVVQFFTGQGRLRMSPIGGIDLNWTAVYVARMTHNVAGRILTAQYPPSNLLIGWWNYYMDTSYVEGFLQPEMKQSQNTNWQLYTGAGEGTPGDARAWLYSNGVFLSGGHLVTGGWKDTFALSGYAPTTAEETPNCQVAEVLLYDRRLTDPERNQVEDYLRTKWGPL